MKSQSWPRLDSLLFLLSLNNPFFPLQFPPEPGDDDEHGEGGDGEHGEGGDDDDDGLFSVGASDGDDDGWKEAVC